MRRAIEPAAALVDDHDARVGARKIALVEAAAPVVELDRAVPVPPPPAVRITLANDDALDVDDAGCDVPARGRTAIGRGITGTGFDDNTGLSFGRRAADREGDERRRNRETDDSHNSLDDVKGNLTDAPTTSEAHANR